MEVTKRKQVEVCWDKKLMERPTASEVRHTLLALDKQ
jgi:hypothetical protein